MTEEEFIAAGRPMEGAFQSLLDAAYRNAGMNADETRIARQLFFAGARAVLHYINGALSENDFAERCLRAHAELEAFLPAHMASIRTDGSA